MTTNMRPLPISNRLDFIHVPKKLKSEYNHSPPSIISWNADKSVNADDQSVPSLSTQDSSCTINSPVPSAQIVPFTDDDQDCVSFLMTLKYRTKNVEDDVRSLKEGFRKTRDEIQEELNSKASAPNCSNSNLEEDGIPLGLPCDSKLLSPLQSYIRSQCVQAFTASESDCITQQTRSRSKISLGRVGIRCAFCHSSNNDHKRIAQSVSFPNQISGIYSAVVMIQSRHFKMCPHIPDSVRARIEELKHIGRKNRGEGNKRSNYWAESAQMLGLVDTDDGIRYQCQPVLDLTKPIEDENDEPENETKDKQTVRKGPLHKVSTAKKEIQQVQTPNQVFIPSHISSSQILQDSMNDILGDSPLLSPEDADLVPPYLFLAMAQMKPCKLSPEDRVGCYKDRGVGFSGMCCKHCGGAPCFGKYFPASVRSLAQTTTSQTIIKHVSRKCTKCPDEIKILLDKLHKEGLSQGGNYGRGGKETNDGKPKYGSRKIFFQRLWARIHGLEVPSLSDNTKKEEEMSSLGEDSSSVADKSVTTVEETDDEYFSDQKQFRSRRNSERKRKSTFL